MLYAGHYANPDEDVERIAGRLVDGGEIAPRNWADFARGLSQSVLERADALDKTIQGALEHWRVERLSRVDLLILRLALVEFEDFADIPLRVTLNEYIDLANEYGTEESASFVNGVLDRLARGFAHKDFDQHGAPAAENG